MAGAVAIVAVSGVAVITGLGCFLDAVGAAIAADSEWLVLVLGVVAVVAVQSFLLVVLDQHRRDLQVLERDVRAVQCPAHAQPEVEREIADRHQ